MRALLVVVAVVCLAACASSEPTAGATVDAGEAKRLASTYMLCVLGIGCGGTGVPMLHGASWEVPVLAGIAVDPKHPQGWIHINTSSGVASCSYKGRVYPTLTPKELWRREYDFTHR